LLDEPTNHLDIPSQEVLQEVLGNYQGTILLVSHDRYLIDALATQIWEIETGRANLRIFQGTYSQYRLHLEAEQVSLENSLPKAISATQKSRRDRSSNEARRRRARLEEIESQVAGLEEKLAYLENKLETPPPDAVQVQEMGEEYVQLQQQINNLLAEWEELHG
jgi:ATP-binding cassette subfamily F protein 3